MCNVGMCLRLKKQGAIFKFDNGVVDKYEIKKREEKMKKRLV